MMANYLRVDSSLNSFTVFPPIAMFSSGSSLIDTKNEPFGIPVISEETLVNSWINLIFTSSGRLPDSKLINGIYILHTHFVYYKYKVLPLQPGVRLIIRARR